jgi:16S rRNA (guanine527-N7)-methyltransferase
MSAADRARALALTPVSRETAARLDRFVALLHAWQARINLVAASTLPSIWTRHIADSLQLADIVAQESLSQSTPRSTRSPIWVDLGSGGGFPGVPIACVLAETPGAVVHLVERNAKKAAFLRAAVQTTSAPAKVHPVRIEDFVDKFGESADIVTARALAPLERLLEAAYPLLQRGALGVFPKGQDVDAELTRAAKCWSMQASLRQSRTDPNARIVVVRALERRSAPR